MISATYEDFDWLEDLVEEGRIGVVEALINSKSFSQEIYTSLTLPEDEYNDLPRSSPLSMAIRCGQIDIMRMFIDHGLDYYDHDDNDNEEGPPLLDAASTGNLEIVRTLVEDYGYDVKKVHSTGETALTKAIQRRNIDVVEYLVQKGADVNHKSLDGSLLHYCARSGGNGDICNFLLSHGFDKKRINDTDHLGKTALHKAVVHNFHDFDILIKNGANVNLGDHYLRTPFFRGVFSASLAIMKRLHALGADPDALNALGERPINGALRVGKLDLVHFLAVTLNVPLMNLDSQDESSNLLVSAVQNDYLSIVTLLLKAGFQIGPSEYKLLSDYVENLPSSGSGYINNVLSNPRSLADICSFSIRRVLGTSLPQVAESLPLPKLLIDHVNLTHVKPEYLPRYPIEEPEDYTDYSDSDPFNDHDDIESSDDDEDDIHLIS